MEPVSALMAAVKDALSLKLETPFMLFASLVGCLSYLAALSSADSSSPFPTPLRAIANSLTWMGWASGSRWIGGVQSWVVDPSRSLLLHEIFLTLAFFGIAFAAYGTRLAFFAMLGVGGLVETGSTTAAWLVPLLALVGSVLAGRLIESFQRREHEHGTMTFLRLVLALLYFPLALLALVVGPRKYRPEPQSVELELSRQTQRFIDKRLTAFGMASLIPVVGRQSSGFVHSTRLARQYREHKDRKKAAPE